MDINLRACVILAVLVTIKCQMEPSLPLSTESFRQILRSLMPVAKGRTRNIDNTRIVYYEKSIRNYKTYTADNVTSLLENFNFDFKKPTVLYIHGYVEIFSDTSVSHVIRAYIQRGDHNVLALDWANLSFGSYLAVVHNVQAVGQITGKILVQLLKNGLSVEGLHIVGHSAGAHVAAVISRVVENNGFIVPRLTGLDPAYPGFYPPFYSPPINPSDATFVDIIHTDAGKFGAPSSTGHADFWPNDGSSKQPGCFPLTIILTVEDFCSHWRSWKFWAESVSGGKFVARNCADYDQFLRGNCTGTALMGILASPDLRGNFYLRTASKEPFALGERGAV